MKVSVAPARLAKLFAGRLANSSVILSEAKNLALYPWRPLPSTLAHQIVMTHLPKMLAMTPGIRAVAKFDLAL